MSADRRRHRVFKTRHTEYHLRDDECVGVRDRASGLWIVDHAAIRLRTLRIAAPRDVAAWVGRRLQFWGRDTDLVTSPVEDVQRPSLFDLSFYVSHARAGVIEV